MHVRTESRTGDTFGDLFGPNREVQRKFRESSETVILKGDKVGVKDLTRAEGLTRWTGLPSVLALSAIPSTPLPLPGDRTVPRRAGALLRMTALLRLIVAISLSEFRLANLVWTRRAPGGDIFRHRCS
jgi:hypothetical protein